MKESEVKAMFRFKLINVNATTENLIQQSIREITSSVVFVRL